MCAWAESHLCPSARMTVRAAHPEATCLAGLDTPRTMHSMEHQTLAHSLSCLAIQFPFYELSDAIRHAYLHEEVFCRIRCDSNPPTAGHVSGRRATIVRVLGAGAGGLVVFASATEGKKVLQDLVWEAPSATDSLMTASSFAVKFMNLQNSSPPVIQCALQEAVALQSCTFFSILRCRAAFLRQRVTREKDSALPRQFLAKETATHACRTALERAKRRPGAVVGLAVELEYMDNGDLQAEIRSRRRKGAFWDQRDVLLIFGQLVMAVHYLHRHKGILHRDIKSKNVLLGGNGLVKLADFGFSMTCVGGDFDELHSSSFCGTRNYMAPEVWNRAPYNYKADMFSLGVILHELLTLRRPFDRRRRPSVLHEEQPPPMRTSGQYSEELLDLVPRLLSHDPDQRPRAIDILCIPLFRRSSGILLGALNTGAAEPWQPMGDAADACQSSPKAGEASAMFTGEEARLMEAGLHLVTQDVVAELLRRSIATPPRGFAGCHKWWVAMESPVQKKNERDVWKSRYLQLVRRASSAHEQGGDHASAFELRLSVSRDALERTNKFVRQDVAGIIDCYPVDVQDEPRRTGDVGFDFLCRQGTTFSFQVEGEELRERWIAAALASIGAYRGELPPVSTGPPVPSAALVSAKGAKETSFHSTFALPTIRSFPTLEGGMIDSESVRCRRSN